MPEPHVQSGSVAEALANGRKLLTVNPAAALQQADTLLRTEPSLPSALRLRAAAMRALGRLADAEAVDSQAIAASQSIPVLAAAARALRTGMAHAHLAPLRAHLESEPDDPIAHLMVGEILAARGQLHSAETELRHAIHAAPAYLEAHVSLARILHQEARPRDALTALDPALQRRPGNVDLLRFRATLLTEAGDHDGAATLYRMLLQHLPDEADLWIGLGNALRTLGKKGECETAYRLGLARAPGDARLLWNLAAIGADIDEATVSAMEDRIASSRISIDDATHLHFALAALRERSDDAAAAFAQYNRGNALRRSTLSYDADALSHEISRCEQLFTTKLFHAGQGGDPSTAPIFVIGMPRSGSTLVEQILASHPQVEGTAELPIIPALVRTFAAEHGLEPGASYRDLLAALPADRRSWWGRQYLERSRAHRRTKRPHFVDKLPHNWLDIGFIRLILPNARIVDVRRNPIDCCVSNFRLLFAQGHPSSFSLREMAEFYRDYVRLMRHIDSVLPGYVHRVIYERLVADIEGETRRLLEHLGLPFDPACLDFHHTDRAVATASAEQVRRPLNSSGIGAWKRYADWLDPMIEKLGNLPQTYDR